jgi:hypothetical protein
VIATVYIVFDYRDTHQAWDISFVRLEEEGGMLLKNRRKEKRIPLAPVRARTPRWYMS